MGHHDYQQKDIINVSKKCLDQVDEIGVENTDYPSKNNRLALPNSFESKHCRV